MREQALHSATFVSSNISAMPKTKILYLLDPFDRKAVDPESQRQSITALSCGAAGPDESLR